MADPDDSPSQRRLAELAALAQQIAAVQGIGAENGPLPSPAPLAPLPQMTLARGRVHELTGPARTTLAALAAAVAQGEGPVVWLRPGWRNEQLCPQGLRALLPDPGALIVVPCAKPVDVLWSLEEALRAGCVALVLAELADAPDLRALRRLHLAAGEGLARNRQAGRVLPAPLGLVMACDSADSRIAGVESRWALHPLAPTPDARRQRWRLDRLLTRSQPPRDWEIDGGPLPEGTSCMPLGADETLSEVA
ncbi:ImuA family protein [Pararhodobacter zhoushanensis]|uniref:Protein ImuA n=1 Tax=Pararhodobacter zhoushanensis TaxID=2479545 RepID=A0ABT3GYN6_9RHOB|nr:hypothetical protein [Pararhodobacter zhoushanensis]MCW1932663.1 hypothetical protein [Pararhodobacter zhoushanensis]